MFNEKLMRLYVNSKQSDKEGIDPLLKKYENLIFHPFEEIVKKHKPEKWGFKIARQLKKLESIDNDKRMRDFIDDYMPLMWDALRQPLSDEKSIARMTIHTINNLNKFLPIKNFDRPKTNFIPIEEFSRINNRLSYVRKKRITRLYYHFNGSDVEIPLMEGVWNKGGDARIVLKALFNENLMESEIPLNDHDVCVKDYNIGKNYMQEIGEADLSGIEIFNNIIDVIVSRDLDINQTLISADGIIFTDIAQQAIVSEYVRPIGADQGVFGKGTFFVKVIDQDNNQMHNVQIFKPRIAYERAAKFVIEGKAKGFFLDDNNTQLFMGIFIIVALCRMIKKSDCCQRIEKMYYLLDQMQIIDQYRYAFKHLLDSTCDDIFDLLENAHRLYPFFELENKGQDDQVAQWLILKLNKWFRNEFRDTYHLYSDEFINSLKIDLHAKEKKYTLDNFKSDPSLIEKLKQWLPGFKLRCRQRSIDEGSMLIK